ncbi:CTP-dependent diacylglycerol kinase 1 [Colletotrichum spaethianum]|uniref:CTP-dependent diacylglycerol kinase 1 n=1 Tax=Colletotrichum spaethianum TaxID=700344 RepID=A0AA37PH85_9PEZI|nr:CTP-dependent diacylglycerol kinase 1 [Colletotrichum spaethianum]GKT52298.1 CTP-dependent diacylglycerol kinase 1 [Colletotrichum spaethianum]
MSSVRAVPSTPRVISPSPTPSEIDAASQDNYFGPVTRSAAKKRRATPQPLEERAEEDDYEPSTMRRSRTRSRSPIESRRITPMTSVKSQSKRGKSPVIPSEPITNDVAAAAAAAPGEANGIAKAPTANGHLAPPSAAPAGWSWRDFSRSPSPLGLIPIHRKWRTFVHKHEVPRKVLHVSIGFFTLWLYVSGIQTSSVAPWLFAALMPITTADYLRHNYASFNRFYVSVLGALMRESEYAGWNGVIFYLLGAWISLRFFPKDVGVMGILLLSWCDTAASTFGRLYGAYTPRIRRGKSLAGSSAAFLVGVISSYFFWGWLAPRTGPFPGDENYPFMFTGALHLPRTIASAVGLSDAQATITGPLALGVMGLWSGFVAAASEVVDIFGWDDNLTIPVLSGAGIWGFLKIFG